jgi:hypothetical protein
MRNDTQTVTIEATPKAVVDFVGDPSNLVRWAIGFAKGVRRDADRWILTTGQGDVPISVDVDDNVGTIDFRIELTPGVESVAYGRAVPNETGTEFLFTQFQPNNMSDAMFDQSIAAVAHELVALKARVEVKCPL